MKPSRPPVRVLHLEDDVNDHLLVTEILRADSLSCEFTLAKTKNEFSEALHQSKFDLIISDYSLPSYDGLSALKAAQATDPELPFIFFSGTIGEEIAVDSLRNGAVDYVLKQRPSRLVAAVRRALRNAAERARLKQAERALQQSEERFRVVARATNDVIWDWDLQTDKIWSSESFAAMFGHRPEAGEMPFASWMELIHPDDKARIMNGLSSLLANGGKVWWSEHRFRRADGTHAFVLDRASVVHDAAGKAVRMVGVIIDMSERRQAEEKIREQAALLDRAQDAIILCKLDREIIYWNKGAERIYGWPVAEALGKNVRQLLFRGDLPPQIHEAVRAMDERGEWMGELPMFTRDDRVITIHARSTLVRDDDGRPKNLLLINTDITEHKQLEEQFLRAQRLESLGVLVSGIAHDLNNTLLPILIGVEILRMQPLTEDAASMVNTMEASARRSADMVKQMLIFARGGESTKTLIAPGQLVKEMCRMISDTFPKSIRCVSRISENLHSVTGIPTQIHQVLMNLCVNARDAMNDSGTLALSVENVDWSETANVPGGRPGKYVCISVADTGEGIPPDQMGKIFQPFFSTKAPGKGTGLGLSTCQSIVKNHAGFITVHSERGKGTEFKVFLPVVVPVADTAADTLVPASPGGHGECILVVDDKESILALARAALENYGYKVVTAASGLEAIGLVRQNSPAIDLVLMDEALPFMDGNTLVNSLRKIRSHLKIVVVGKMEEKSLKLDGIITKPFTTENLLAGVHAALASKQ